MNTVPHHIFSLAQKTYSKHLGTNPENTYLLTMENAYEETPHLKSHSSQGAKPVGCCYHSQQHLHSQCCKDRTVCLVVNKYFLLLLVMKQVAAKYR